MFSSLFEAETGAGNQILDSSRYSISPAPASAETREAMWTAMPCTSSPAISISPVWRPPNLNVEWTDRLGNRAGATHCRAGPSKWPEIRLPSDLISLPRYARVPAARGVMSIEQVAPALVAQLFGSRGRAHDVREENGRQDPSASAHGDGSSEKLLDAIADPFVDEKEMIDRPGNSSNRAPGMFRARKRPLST